MHGVHPVDGDDRRETSITVSFVVEEPVQTQPDGTGVGIMGETEGEGDEDDDGVMDGVIVGITASGVVAILSFPVERVWAYPHREATLSELQGKRERKLMRRLQYSHPSDTQAAACAFAAMPGWHVPDDSVASCCVQLVPRKRQRAAGYGLAETGCRCSASKRRTEKRVRESWNVMVGWLETS